MSEPMSVWITIIRCHVCNAVPPYCEWCSRTGMLFEYIYNYNVEAERKPPKVHEKTRVLSQELVPMEETLRYSLTKGV